jgi:hypothetical protein
MNRDELNDNELQDFLLVEIAKNGPVQLNDFLGLVSDQLNLRRTEDRYWYSRLLAMLDQIHLGKSWISIYWNDQDGRHEFNKLYPDPGVALFLETTSKGQRRLERLQKNSSRERTQHEKTTTTIKTVREQLKKSNFEGARSTEKMIEKIAKAIAARRGQSEFRQRLLDTYRKCLITGCDAVDALEAAHIRPYAGGGTFDLSNGLLLRADIHTLFDLGLIAVNADNMTAIVAWALKKTDYGQFDGKILQFPKGCKNRPNKEALREHLKAAGL